MPKRIQLRRTRGWRLPDGAVHVARPTRWGNPFRVDWDRSTNGWFVHCPDGMILGPFVYRTDAAGDAVGLFLRECISEEDGYPSNDEVRAELRGKDLACWCPLDQPCHADVLLEVANG